MKIEFILIAILATIFFSLWPIVAGKSAAGAWIGPFVMGVAALTSFLLTLCIYGTGSLKKVLTLQMSSLGLAGLLYGIGLVLYVYILNKYGTGITIVVIGVLFPSVGVLCTWLLNGDHFTLIQWAGVLIGCVAIFLITYKPAT